MEFESNIDDPTNIAGFSQLVDKRNIDPSFDVMSLEQQIKGDTSNTGGSSSQDLQKQFSEELKNLSSSTLESIQDQYRVPDFPIDDIQSINDVLDGHFQPTNVPERPERPAFERPERPAFERPTFERPERPTFERPESFVLPPKIQTAKSNFSFDIEDDHLQNITNEEKRQRVVDGVFRSDDDRNTTLFDIEHEKEEDEKARKLEQIGSLFEILEDEGEDVSKIPKVDTTNSMKEIDAVLKHLSLKNDRKRAAVFAEETILLGAVSLEWLFDGQRSYLGYRPDLTDWSKTVQTKLRRMKHDTSNVANKIMHTLGIGSFTRIFMELVPSAVLYSRLRASQNKDRLVISDSEFDAGISKIRNYN